MQSQDCIRNYPWNILTFPFNWNQKFKYLVWSWSLLAQHFPRFLQPHGQGSLGKKPLKLRMDDMGISMAQGGGDYLQSNRRLESCFCNYIIGVVRRIILGPMTPWNLTTLIELNKRIAFWKKKEQLKICCDIVFPLNASLFSSFHCHWKKSHKERIGSHCL